MLALIKTGHPVVQSQSLSFSITLSLPPSPSVLLHLSLRLFSVCLQMSHNLRKRQEQGSSKRRARARFLGWDQIPAAGNLWNAVGRGRESRSLLFGLFLSLCEFGCVSSLGRNGKDPIAMDRPRRTSKFPFIGNTTLANHSYLPLLSRPNTHTNNPNMTLYNLLYS